MLKDFIWKAIFERNNLISYHATSHSKVNIESSTSRSILHVTAPFKARNSSALTSKNYRCVECERVQISKHFKNKYSFQRHAFLYHEGHARKVFPCQICQKEFSRPDKMKQHLKQAHEGHPKAASASGSNGRGKNRAGAQAQDEDLPPSTLLINPFRGLSDPADMEGKISSIKESGSRCWTSQFYIPSAWRSRF